MTLPRTASKSNPALLAHMAAEFRADDLARCRRDTAGWAHLAAAGDAVALAELRRAKIIASDRGDVEMAEIFASALASLNEAFKL